MTKYMNNMFEELSNRSRNFWFGLFYVLDEDKKNPVRGKNSVGIAFDDDYTIELNEKCINVYETSNIVNNISVNRAQKDQFPYVKLLDWYLKNSYLNDNHF